MFIIIYLCIHTCINIPHYIVVNWYMNNYISISFYVLFFKHVIFFITQFIRLHIYHGTPQILLSINYVLMFNITLSFAHVWTIIIKIRISCIYIFCMQCRIKCIIFNINYQMYLSTEIWTIIYNFLCFIFHGMSVSLTIHMSRKFLMSNICT